MTKKEREVLQKYFNRIREFQTKGNESFNKLMELNGAEGTGHRWCCASENLRDLLSVKDRREHDHIVCLYDDYVGARAAEEVYKIEKESGAEQAYNILLLYGADCFDGDYDDYSRILADLDNKQSEC